MLYPIKLSILSSKILLLSIFLGLIVTAGCGFQPLYLHGGANKSDIVYKLAHIIISPIENRTGQILRNYLQDKLTPTGIPKSPAYKLDVSLKETRSDMVILRDSTSTFAKIKISAKYRLFHIETKQILNHGTAVATTVFNIVESEYANLNAQRDARRRAVDNISHTIKERLALFFLQKRQ